jgi:hypothetical protein
MLGCMFAGIGLMSIPTTLLAAALRRSEQRHVEACEEHRRRRAPRRQWGLCRDAASTGRYGPQFQ